MKNDERPDYFINMEEPKRSKDEKNECLKDWHSSGWQVERIQLGRKYLVQPTNPKKLKHRGRQGVLVDVDAVFMPSRGAIRFDDNHRIGVVPLEDLVEVDGKEGDAE